MTTLTNAQEVWDEATNASKQICQRALMGQAISAAHSAGEIRSLRGYQSETRAVKLDKLQEVALAAMVILGMENLDEIRQAVVDRSKGF